MVEAQQSHEAVTADQPTPSDALVSVVIPCYNQAQFLGIAIESVRDQTYSRYEVVVVDDGSRDNTSAVARQYPDVRYLRKSNQGVAEARNTGLEACRGEYVVFLDADDVLLPDALAAGVRAFHEVPERGFVFGHTGWIDDDGCELGPPYTPHYPDDYYRAFLAGCCVASPASVMYRRVVLQSLGGFKRSAGMCSAEDYESYFRIARHYPVHCYDVVVALHRQHDANASSKIATMLKGSLSSLRLQRRFIWRSPQYWSAYRVGVRFLKRHYGSLILFQLRRDAQERRWRSTIRGLVALARWWPPGLARFVRSPNRIYPSGPSDPHLGLKELAPS